MSVKLHQNLYVTEKQFNKKKVYVPLDPQPPKSDVLEVHRLYQTLQASHAGPWQYRRRITWMEIIPSYLSELSAALAVTEYIGNFSERKYHGNTKHNDKNPKYIRTKPTGAKN